MPKIRIDRSQRRAIAESLRAASMSSDEEVSDEVVTDEFIDERRNHAQNLREKRRENRSIKRKAARDLATIQTRENEELSEVVVSQHYYLPGSMVMHRKAKKIGLVLEAQDRIISRYACGAVHKIAKGERLSVLAGSEIEQWHAKSVIPADE